MNRIFGVLFVLFFVNAQAQEAIEFEEVEISILPADKKAPTSETKLTSEDIEGNYAGQEMPAIVSKTPSLTWYSDSGAFSGYSYLRLRGIDQTRLGFTLNGVPLNEPEDQVVYLSNFPDFLNSIGSIQIQRGVGINDHGTGGFAGSIHMQTSSLRENAYVDLSSSYGSYRTFRISPEFNSGLMDDHWSFYGRFSLARSDGFRDHSSTQGHSFVLGGAYFFEKGFLKLTALNGNSKINLSYLATPESTLKTNYRFNALSEDEKDSFQQNLVMLQSELSLTEETVLSSNLYYGYAQGEYNVLFSPDLYAFYLMSHLYGGMLNFHHEQDGFKFSGGLHANDYVRNHQSYVQPFKANSLYSNFGHKSEMAVFSKVSKEWGRFAMFGDLQLRMPRFSYEQDKNQNLEFKPITWIFVNPKLGVTFAPTSHQIIYASVGRSSREPTRNDMFAGFDNIDSSSYDQVGDFTKVKPEHVMDYELGTKFVYSTWQVDLNVYDMEFKNEIAAIGELSYIGLPLRKNVASSYRRGIELFADVKPFKKLRFLGEGNISINRIQKYTTDFDSMTYTDVQPLLTPAVQVSQSVEYEFMPWLKSSLGASYISESYLDNTNNEKFKVPSSLIFNGAISLKFWKSTEVSAMANNIFDSKYYTSGYVQSDESYFFPMARRNYFVSMKQRFQ